jgi:transcriptional regulator with XRE-family HTH domain
LDKNLDLIVGAKIAHYRAIKGLTQTELAKQAELSTSYISHIEKGVRFPTFKAIVKIAKVLNVSWEELGKSPVTKRLEDLNMPEQEKQKISSIVNTISSFLGNDI